MFKFVYLISVLLCGGEYIYLFVATMFEVCATNVHSLNKQSAIFGFLFIFRKINGDTSRGLFSSFFLIFRLLQLKKRQTEKKKKKNASSKSVRNTLGWFRTKRHPPLIFRISEN